MPTAAPELDDLVGSDTDVLTALAASVESTWVVVLWNDPVNKQPYVTYVLTKVLKLPTDQAEKLMLKAESEGKAAVDAGSQDHCQEVAAKLSAAKLWATVEHG